MVRTVAAPTDPADQVDSDVSAGLSLAIADALLAEDDDLFESLSALAADPEALATVTPGTPAAVEMADDTPAGSARAGNSPPASKDVALAGPDGKDLARLVREAKADGVATLADVCRDALEGYPGTGPLLDDGHLLQLADALAGVNATADLLARSRVREQADRVAVPFRTFADQPAIRIAPPEVALDYFRGLVPSLDLDPERFGDFHRRQAFALAESTNEVLTGKVQDAIAAAIAEGKSTSEATNDVGGLLDAAGVSPANPQYAEMVFRTNAMDAYSQAYHEEGRNPDLRGQFPAWQYVGIDDHRAGKDHRPKFGKYYPAEASFAEVRGPRPFNCLPPGQSVQGRFVGGLKASYSGELVEIHTRGGRRLSVTPNHPVLTDRGFVPAADLKEGINLVCYRGEGQVGVLAVNDQHPPSRIEDVFQAFSVLVGGPREAPLSPLDLHGDAAGTDGQVEVVRPDRVLLIDGDVAGDQGVSQPPLAVARVGNQGMSRGSPLGLDGRGVPHAPPGFVGGSDLGLAAGGIDDARPFDRLGRGSAADRHAGGNQPLSDHVPAHPEGVRDLLLRLAGRVPPDRGGRRGRGERSEPLRLGRGSDLDAVRPEPNADGVGTDPEFPGELARRFPGKVTADVVSKIIRRHYSGPVYDLETDVGYYVANGEQDCTSGIIVSNCRCGSRWVDADEWQALQARGVRLETNW